MMNDQVETQSTNTTNEKNWSRLLLSVLESGALFLKKPETTFLLGPGGIHFEHHAASDPRCRGAGDQRCVEIII